MAEAARGLGADEVLDHRATRPADLGRFDLVLGTAGGSGLEAFRRLVALGREMVTIAWNPPASLAAVVASSVHAHRGMRFFSGDPERADLMISGSHVERGMCGPSSPTLALQRDAPCAVNVADLQVVALLFPQVT